MSFVSICFSHLYYYEYSYRMCYVRINYIAFEEEALYKDLGGDVENTPNVDELDAGDVKRIRNLNSNVI